MHGSGDLIQTPLRHGFVDSKVPTTGVVMAAYEPEGQVVIGSFVLK